MSQEYKICERKGKEVTFPVSIEDIVGKLRGDTAEDALIVMKECIEIKASASFFVRKIKSLDMMKIVPIEERKLPKNVVELMIEGCTKNAAEDLAIAKEFEQVENELDETCDI